MVNRIRQYFPSLALAGLLLGLSGEAIARVNPGRVLNSPEYDIGRRLRFGIATGINFTDFNIRSSPTQPGGEALYADISRLQGGFNVNALAHYRIATPIQLRFSPGLLFAQRNLLFFDRWGYVEERREIHSSFVELPLHFKYNAQRRTNARPYLVFGGTYRVDMSAIRRPESDRYLRLLHSDFYYDIGVGFEFFLVYFKFATELRYSFGVLNVLDHGFRGEDNARLYDALERINSHVFTLAFHFE